MGEGGYLQINQSLNADAFDERLLPDVGRISPLVTPGKVSNIGVRCSKLGMSKVSNKLACQWLLGRAISGITC